MAQVLSHRRINSDTERTILTGLIVSDRVCEDLFHIIRPEYFQVDYAADVFKWISSFYSLHGEAPGKHIRDIFEGEKKKLDVDKAATIERFLADLSADYEEQSSFNEGFLVDQAILYIKERALLLHAKNVESLTGAGRLDQAEVQIANFKKVTRLTSSWVNPLSPEEVNAAMDIERDVMFSFPGKLGRLAGPFERGFFIAFLGPIKRTKTWWLQELAITGLLYGFKVVFISLEMHRYRVERRIYKRIMSAVKYGGTIAYPCFDCLNNQDGTCMREERENKITLLSEDGELPTLKDFYKTMKSGRDKYRPCTYCREQGLESYIPATWFEGHKRPGFDLDGARKAVRGFGNTYGSDSFRLKSYPRFSANIADVKRDLDILRYSDNFIPDLIVVDYADILAPETQLSEKRDMVDDTWMTLARLASENYCMVVTASQSNKASWDKKTVRGKDVSEDYRKMAHVDMMFSLNQTPQEKRRKIMRVGLVAHRDRDFDEFNQVMVLQQLDAGQPFIDSEWAE